MLYIKRGNSSAKVSRRAYETMYKRLGFIVIGDESEMNKQAAVNAEAYAESDEKVEEAEEAEEEQDVDVDEIPVSEMNREQLVKYAERHGIDLSGVKNTREARQRVQKAIRESNM